MFATKTFSNKVWQERTKILHESTSVTSLLEIVYFTVILFLNNFFKALCCLVCVGGCLLFFSSDWKWLYFFPIWSHLQGSQETWCRRWTSQNQTFHKSFTNTNSTSLGNYVSTYIQVELVLLQTILLDICGDFVSFSLCCIDEKIHMFLFYFVLLCFCVCLRKITLKIILVQILGVYVSILFL